MKPSQPGLKPLLRVVSLLLLKLKPVRGERVAHVRPVRAGTVLSAVTGSLLPTWIAWLGFSGRGYAYSY